MRKNLTLERLYLLGTKPTSLGSSLVIHDIETDRMAFAGDKSYKFLPYQLWMVGYLPTMALTGNGRSGFDSGERSLRDGYHIQGRQQARKLPNPDTGR